MSVTARFGCTVFTQLTRCISVPDFSSCRIDSRRSAGFSHWFARKSDTNIRLYAYNGATPTLLKSAVTNAEGRPPEGPLVQPADMKTGRYRIDVHVGDYYKKIGAKLPGGYHTRLTMEFDIYDAKQPHHLPFQITPWTQSSSVLPG